MLKILYIYMYIVVYFALGAVFLWFIIFFSLLLLRLLLGFVGASDSVEFYLCPIIWNKVQRNVETGYYAMSQTVKNCASCLEVLDPCGVVALYKFLQIGINPAISFYFTHNFNVFINSLPTNLYI